MRKIFFDSSFVLLCFLTLVHVSVLISFLTLSKISPLVFPASLLIVMIAYLLIEKHHPCIKFQVIGLSLIVIIISLIASAFYFDLSWDGQWYHQSAIYHMKQDWNPIFDPIRTFEKRNSSSICHFPKGSWFYAAAVYSTTGVFEMGKSINFILIFVTLFLIGDTARSYSLSKIKSLFIALLVVLNPVVWSETTTYLVDGLLYLYLSIYIVLLFRWFKQPDYKVLFILLMAIAGLVNVKFTGLVFFCVLAFAATIYIFFYSRKYLVKSIAFHAVALLFSVLVMGYNPYVTNYTERGHPLYPIMGTEEYPSVFEQTGRDSNEKSETPHNMRGKNLFTRMFYANFGRPDNAPYFKEKDAELIWPFTSGLSDWKAYFFHETRVSGFGPYFGGVLILTFILLLFLWKKDKRTRWLIILIISALLGSLMFSKHFWWPRFGPQMWLIPIIPVVFFFYSSVSKRSRLFAWLIAFLILLNGSIVLYAHMYWETSSSIKLRKQLTELSEKKVPIEINYGWFIKSMEEKLDYWQVNYEQVPRKEIKDQPHDKLVSVVEGYPNEVLFRKRNRSVSLQSTMSSADK